MSFNKPRKLTIRQFPDSQYKCSSPKTFTPRSAPNRTFPPLRTSSCFKLRNFRLAHFPCGGRKISLVFTFNVAQYLKQNRCFLDVCIISHDSVLFSIIYFHVLKYIQNESPFVCSTKSTYSTDEKVN